MTELTDWAGAPWCICLEVAKRKKMAKTLRGQRREVTASFTVDTKTAVGRGYFKLKEKKKSIVLWVLKRPTSSVPARET